MKAQLNKSDLPKKRLTKKSKESKKDKSKKLKRTESSLADDSELDKKLQSEVKLFLNSEFENNKIGKTKYSKLKNFDENTNYKLLNQNKYDSKLLKKNKLKQNNLTKLEKKKNKKSAQMENYADAKSNDNNSIEHSVYTSEKNLHKKMHRTQSNNLKKTNDDFLKGTVEGKIQKKKGKQIRESKMKKLFQKFDKMNIEQDTPIAFKKIEDGIKSIKIQENIDDSGNKKKNKNKAKKLRKKEKILRQLLKEKNVNIGEDTDNSKQKEKSRPSIATITSQIQRLKTKIPESSKTKRKSRPKEKNVSTLSDKKKLKKSMAIVDVEMKQGNTENSLGLKKRKKKKIETNINENTVSIIAAKKSKSVHADSKIQESVCEGNEVPNILASQSSGGHRKEKYFNSKHTPLREKLMNKLKAARFRYLNEQLYTSKSGESKDFFLQDPKSFEAYHEGFKKQVSQWPINPVDIIIKSIQEKESSRQLVIADLGCGEAQLAAALDEHKVHSLDLVALNDRVTPCDMTHTPLKSGSVDVAVFCLSLMGTDLPACVKEANRILKLGGEMKIAEVESRFHDVKDFVKDIQKYGFEKTNLNMDYSLFFFLDFKKVSHLSKSKKKKLPDINLKPCLYKKR